MKGCDLPLVEIINHLVLSTLLGFAETLMCHKKPWRFWFPFITRLKMDCCSDKLCSNRHTDKTNECLLCSVAKTGLSNSFRVLQCVAAWRWRSGYSVSFTSSTQALLKGWCRQFWCNTLLNPINVSSWTTRCPFCVCWAKKKSVPIKLWLCKWDINEVAWTK